MKITLLFWLLNITTNLVILLVAREIVGGNLGWFWASALGAAWGIVFTIAWMTHRVDSRSW